MLLVRHASAGDRDSWEGDDTARPLDERGRSQSAALVGLLEPHAIDRILSSPAVRCLETVMPLATARGVDVEIRAELGEDRQESDGAALVRSLAGSDALVCGHGGLEHALPGPPKWRKGEAFVVDTTLTVVATIRP